MSGPPAILRKRSGGPISFSGPCPRCGHTLRARTRRGLELAVDEHLNRHKDKHEKTDPRQLTLDQVIARSKA